MTSPQPHFLLLRDPERVPRPPRCARTSEARAPPNTIPCFNPDAIGAAQLEPLKCLNLRASIVRQTDLLASLRAKLTGRPETPSKRASLSGRRGGARPVDADRGKDDPEAGALADAAVHLDAPAVPIDDAVNDREPEPRALADVLGGEERIEDPRQHVGRDAGTVVAHGDLDLAVAPRGDNLDRAARCASGGEADRRCRRCCARAPAPAGAARPRASSCAAPARSPCCAPPRAGRRPASPAPRPPLAPPPRSKARWSWSGSRPRAARGC